MPIIIRKSRKNNWLPVPSEPLPDAAAKTHLFRKAIPVNAVPPPFSGRAWRTALPTEPPDVAVCVPLRPLVSRGAPPPPYPGRATHFPLPTEPADVAGPVQHGIIRTRAANLEPPANAIFHGRTIRQPVPESESFYIVRRRWSRPGESFAPFHPPPNVGRVRRLAGPKQIVLGADSLRLFHTGAAADGDAQTDPDASLGNYRSSTEAERTGILYNALIRGLQVTFGSRANGATGTTGSITLATGTSARYTAEGSSIPGAEKEIPYDTIVTLADGADPSKFIRVRRVMTTPMSGHGTVTFFDQFNNVFGMLNADNTEQGAGSAKYRAVMVRNVSSELASSIVFRVLPLDGTVATTSAGQLGASGSGTITGATDAFCDWPITGWARIQDSGGTLREIVHYTSRTDTALTVPSAGRGRLGTSAGAGAATDTATPVPGIRIAWEDASPKAGGNVQTIADEDTAPTGVTWSTAITVAAGVSAGQLDGGDQGALWIHRELPAGVAASPEQHSHIEMSFTVAGVDYAEPLCGMYRVADTDIEGYELHIGTDAEPDITGTPDETFASLPHTTTATLAAGATYYLVTNFRNRYGLRSESLETTIITIDGSGNAATNPPTAPVLVSWSVAASGAFKATAIYFYEADGDNQADTWLVYTTFNGVDPDPGVDTPATSTITKADGMALLEYTTATQSDGVTGKVLVRVRRTADTTDSTNTTITSATADATAPTTPDGQAFWRGAGEQVQ